MLLLLVYFALSRHKINPVEGDRAATVVVSPPKKEQTEEWKGDV